MIRSLGRTLTTMAVTIIVTVIVLVAALVGAGTVLVVGCYLALWQPKRQSSSVLVSLASRALRHRDA